MQELRGEEEPGGEGPRGPHKGDIKGESGPRGPHREHLNHETLTSTRLDLSQFKHDSSDVQECHRSLGPLDLQHPQSRRDTPEEHGPMGPRDPVSLPCLRPADVDPGLPEPEQRDAPEAIEQQDPDIYTYKQLYPADPLLRPSVKSVGTIVDFVQPTLYHREHQQVPLQPYDKAGHLGAREAAFLSPGMDPSCVQLFPQEPAHEEFPLMLDPISALGLHEDMDGEETGVDLPGSGSPSPEPGDIFGEMAADHMLVHEVRRRGVNMTEGVPVPSSEHVAEIVGRQGQYMYFIYPKSHSVMYCSFPVLKVGLWANGILTLWSRE